MLAGDFGCYMRIKIEKHIAEIEPWEYFLPVLNSEKDAKDFVEQARKNQTSSIIVHQCSRMLYLADKIYQRGRPAFDILFFIIIAEMAAKTKFNFVDEGYSKKYVGKFFKEILNKEERDQLGKSFFIEYQDKEKYLSIDEVTELLYKVRCDIVHRGIYFDTIVLKDNDGDENTVFHWKDNQYISPRISTIDLRKIILKGVVKACKT